MIEHVTTPEDQAAGNVDWRLRARQITAWLRLWRRRHRTRRELARLGDEYLDDIGLQPDHREGECAKRFWQK
ncbi:MAG: DUF1127 domain-containing protein [Geminicoccaceae bacterium]